MARLPALVDTLTAHDFRDRGTVDFIARLVRHAGLVQTTKRGLGAAQMTARDAAALVLALNGSETARDSAQAAEQYGGLIPWIDGEAMLDLPPELQPLALAANFGEAIEVLIESAPALERLGSGGPGGGGSSHSRSGPDPLDAFATGDAVARPPLLVAFHLPEPGARILLVWRGTRGRTRSLALEYRRLAPLVPRHIESRNASPRPISDRKVVVSLSLVTFLAIHRLLYTEARTDGGSGR